MSVLVGSLEAFALPDIFRLLAHNKQTGGLKVERESGDGVIFFRDGEVYFAFSSLTREFLGQRLVNAKLITQGQLLRILDEQKKGGNRRLGDLLIEKGILSKELLDTFIKEQIQDAIFNLLQWDMGTFTFEAGEVSSQEIGLSVSVENLIMESSRRLEEWEVIQRKIPSLDVVVRMAPTPPEDAMEINIKPEEWTLLVLADGRSVRDIAAATERSEFEACKIIYGLVTAGLLEVASGRSPTVKDEPSRLGPRDLDDLVVSRAPEVQADPEPTQDVQAPGGVSTPVSEIPQVASDASHDAVVAEEFASEEATTLVASTNGASHDQSESQLQVHEASSESGSDEQAQPMPSVNVTEHTGFETEIPSADAGQPLRARASAATGKAAETTISKETLLRLIAGVRNL
ncbi:MAG: DUF4388 domain-containing protein [Actinomycetota bacterium]|nr:DUF4388 domain-containing protein [Actinomycetota bacterium]